MGFGLHVGWGIEGAIGSEFKIDASYLSPNVNLAARLEAASWQYGVPLLLSGSLRDLCTKKMWEICREIDCVKVKGSLQPMRLFTIPVSFNKMIEVKDRFKEMKFKDKKENWWIEKQTVLKSVYDGKTSTWEVIWTDAEF